MHDYFQMIDILIFTFPGIDNMFHRMFEYDLDPIDDKMQMIVESEMYSVDHKQDLAILHNKWFYLFD
jgi:hypothetical protein